MGLYVDRLNQKLKADLTYQREQYQSYMTGPEWRNVEMVEEYAAFLKEGKSMFQFPYFRQIAELWRVMYQSYRAARKYNSIFDIVFSEYLLMDLFVCVFTTFELIPKGFLSLVFSLFTQKENQTEIQRHLADFSEAYAKALQLTPFFDHDYATLKADLAQKYHASKGPRTWVDWLSWKVTSFELSARYWIAKPLKYLLHVDNAEGGSTDVLVKFHAENAQNAEQAEAMFHAALGGLTNVTLVEPINVKEQKEDKPYLSVYARLRTPRYKAFKEVVPALTAQNIHLKKIAGQSQVQVKCLVENETAGLPTSEHANALYTYGDSIHPKRKFCLFDVPVNQLQAVVKDFSSQEHPVEFIHNF